MQARGLKHKATEVEKTTATVAPHAGAWIETLKCYPPRLNVTVAPHAGAWIETYAYQVLARTSNVAPHAGAWIETLCLLITGACIKVAPHAGAWIETHINAAALCGTESRLMQARGLKPT